MESFTLYEKVLYYIRNPLARRPRPGLLDRLALSSETVSIRKGKNDKDQEFKEIVMQILR